MSVIALDFDGTVVKHQYPSIGADIGAVPWIRRWLDAGARIVLYTMRDGDELSDAKRWFERHGLWLYGAQFNPSQAKWTSSPKCYANIYVDDAAFGVPLIRPEGERPHVDWSVVGPGVLEMLGG